MSRKIKFRVAKKHNDKDWMEHHGYDGLSEKDYFVMLEVDEVYFDSDCIHGKCSAGSSCPTPSGDYDVIEEDFDTSNGDVLMQFTGLKDKNGDGLTEVYEGDIISIDGTLKGNIYENDKEPTDIVIPQLGTKAWADAYKEAVDRGYNYSE